MGDRTGLKKIDRTNGYEDGNNYMKVKKSKLADQNDQIRDAIRQRNSTSRTDLFKGISISVNGRTQPTADELKRLILLNGGDYHPYYRYQTTKFMVATNLSIARMKQLRPDDRIVRPEWITDSISSKCLLPYEDYQLFVEEHRGRNGSSVLPINIANDGNSNSSDQHQLVSVAESYSRSYRDSRQRANQRKAEVSKSKDIREMFSRSVRSISKGPEANDQILEAISQRISTSRTDLFKDISISVNGKTKPTADELKRLILLNGGDYHPYYRYQTTKFIVATDLSGAMMKQLRPDDRTVRPEWITDSIQVSCLLPYEDYQLSVDEPRGRNGSELPINVHDDNNSNSNDQHKLVSVAESNSRSSRDLRQRAGKQKAEVSKSRDIREMFSRSVRSISKGPEQNDQMREAICQRISTSRSDLFKGISISVNGPTQPTADELKRIILLNGGDYHPYYRYQTTKFMVATSLSSARMKQLRPDDRIVRPEWITDSIQVSCLLPYEDYQLVAEGQQAANVSVLTIDVHDDINSDSSDQPQLVSLADSDSSDSRDSGQKSSKQKAEVPKSRDIREMFSRPVRGVSKGT